MVPIDTPRKRIAFLIITILVLSFSASSAKAATKAATTTKKAATVTAKKATAAKTATVVKGEKITANKVSVVGDNTISTYTVKKGDTLSSIALKYDISINTLRWSNDLTSKSAIKVGQKLTILPTSGVIYTVKTGDTLSEIAANFQADQDDILNANNLDDSDSLKVGMKLTIPNVEPLDTKAAATSVHDETTPTENISPIELPVAAAQTPTVAPVIVVPTAILNPVTPVLDVPAVGTVMMVTNPVTTDKYAITIKQTSAMKKYDIPSVDIRGYYAQPISGKLSQGIHDVNAVDISAPIGTTVHAAADGTVIVAKGDGKYNGGYGNYIVVSHPNNTQTLYAHLSSVSVDLGEVVVQGEPIGLSGKTGKVTGAHLHFEIRGATNPWGSDSKGTAYEI